MAEPPYELVDELEPGIARVLAHNPSAFTYTGTQTWIVGVAEVAIIDPGPDDPAHVDAIVESIAGRPVSAILCTHTHRDHSPNTARIKAATGAPVYAEGVHRASRPRFESEKHNPESGADRDRLLRFAQGAGDAADGLAMEKGAPFHGEIDAFGREERNGYVAGRLADANVVDGIRAAPKLDPHCANVAGVAGTDENEGYVLFTHYWHQALICS